jgi:cyclopropane-fatty-acyl-phospholipid synthase
MGSFVATWGERQLTRALLRVLGDPPVRVELWDGDQIRAPAADPDASPKVRLHDRRALFELLHRPTLTFGDLFSSGRLTVDRDLTDVLDTLYGRILSRERARGPLHEALSRALAHRPRANSLEGSRDNIHRHYDLGNDFYALWLDREHMQYTCAYFPNENVSLEQAQEAKLEHVARKLRLRPGETVVEAGGGWGGLARYFARRHGVRVRSYNISGEQVACARERAREEGLEDRVEYVEDDYRNITWTYDAFVSVGMLEHVGVRNYRALGAAIDRSLKDDGRGLIHAIGQNVSRPPNAWIEENIFPGAYPPTLREMMGVLEPFGFSVADVENLRPHYARTLRHWRERFEAHRDAVVERFDERFARAWYLYLSGSISAFTGGQLQLFQVLFQRPGCRALPETREDLHADA